MGGHRYNIFLKYVFFLFRAFKYWATENEEGEEEEKNENEEIA